jgi:hypothetical protein
MIILIIKVIMVISLPRLPLNCHSYRGEPPRLPRWTATVTAVNRHGYHGELPQLPRWTATVTAVNCHGCRGELPQLPLWTATVTAVNCQRQSDLWHFFYLDRTELVTFINLSFSKKNSPPLFIFRPYWRDDWDMLHLCVIVPVGDAKQLCRVWRYIKLHKYLSGCLVNYQQLASTEDAAFWRTA